MPRKPREPKPGGRKPPQSAPAPRIEYRHLVRFQLDDQARWSVAGYVEAYDDVHAIAVARRDLTLANPRAGALIAYAPATARQVVHLGS